MFEHFQLSFSIIFCSHSKFNCHQHLFFHISISLSHSLKMDRYTKVRTFIKIVNDAQLNHYPPSLLANLFGCIRLRLSSRMHAHSKYITTSVRNKLVREIVTSYEACYKAVNLQGGYD